jgi:hypothetical protein
MKIRPVGVELFHADEQTRRQMYRQTDRPTDMTKITVALHNFTNAPKHCYYLNKVLNKFISRCFATSNGNGDTKSLLFPLCCHVFVRGEAHLLVT